ncbi:calcium-translocating P-type ATPase PMCA-type [Clostridium sp. CAG:571]|nr:calcium-translocating P-type ATPase PMCA-type [Clostridium sp. CAG:571]
MEKNWFSKSVDEVKKELLTDLEKGLTDEQISKQREKFGKNELKAQKKKSLFVKFLEQFKDFMIIVLIIAAIISGVVGYMQGEGITDSIIILIVVIVNAIIGVAQEAKAEKSLEALQKLSSHSAKVMRNGILTVVPSKELVPGDIVILDTGDFVPADLRIIEAANLKSQESSLTGESVPVEKYSEVIKDEKVGIGDRVNMLFSSSLITYGRGKGIVVETGMNTEVGKIAGIINDTEKAETPLQIKLNKLGKTLGLVALAICAFIFIIGLIYGKEPLDMFMTAVSLAVAAIPEGLAAVSTIVLAIGVQRMVKKHAIVKKLPAVETLGSATVICSDKTGTLTQNKMTVKKIFYDNKLVDIDKIEQNEIKDDLEKLVYVSMLCNDTKVGRDNELTGDPTETALVDMGFVLDFKPELFEMLPRVGEIPFDSNRKLMTTIHKYEDKYLVYTKGGVDELLKRCNKYILNNEIKNDLNNFKNSIQNINEKMAKEALRVLAMGYKELDHMPSDEEMKNIESDLIYVGMVGMIDPPREEAKVAVEKCKTAGIKTVMITGDHKITATAIAKSLGILENESEAITGAELEEMSDEDLAKNIRKYSVYARVSPEHKVRIVRAWQKNGEIVAMTGDGVNDAPALKKADIGCAMGMVGTDVAKEAADVILTDDNFATVVSAVEEGRRIYDNILKAIQFLLSSNVGEIIVLFVAILITPLLSKAFGIDIKLIEPLLPIHILWVNLVTDSLPALALAVDPAEKDVMTRKPLKPGKGIFTKGMTWRIVYQGIMIGLLTLAAFCIGLATPESSLPEVYNNEGVRLSNEEVKVEIGQTMAFTVLALSELVHVFNIRNNKKSIFKTGIFNNSKLILAIAVSAALMFVILLIPSLRQIFSIPVLPLGNIIETILLVLAPLAIVELFKLFKINTIKGE